MFLSADGRVENTVLDQINGCFVVCVKGTVVAIMASSGYYYAAVVLLAVQLLCVCAADAEEAGTVIPAESR